MLNITKSAQNRIKEMLEKHEEPDLGLRISVIGGGCSGFSWDMAFDMPRETDEVTETDSGVKVLVDPISYKYITGTEIDWVETIQGAGFSFHNPNSVRTCGCGKSFSV